VSAQLLHVEATDPVAAGVTWIAEPVAGVTNGQPLLAGGQVLDVDNIIWCTRYRQNFHWIDRPIFDG
jgi:putative flavoprotein involved in K+ transport